MGRGHAGFRPRQRQALPRRAVRGRCPLELVTCALAAVACRAPAPTPVTTGDASSQPQTFAVTGASVDTTFVTRDHFMGAVEMQLSGEPFAELMGRSLAGYSRDYLTPDMYFDPALNGGVAGGPVGRVDVVGFSTAVESYEYSKQPMNNLAFESGAGTALAFGPVLNPSGATGERALQGLRSWVQHLAGASHATSRFVHAEVTPNNPLGWPGLWPTLQPFASWNPAIHASNASTGCSISSDDDPGATGSLYCDDYECDYTTLHLPDRATQVDMTIGPGASGWAGWKEALWTLNYAQIMHDSHENAVTAVPTGQLAAVGTVGNSVVGGDGMGGTTLPGTFLGSSDIEGFQAGNFIQILDNQAAQWLFSLSTGDGTTLGGFASLKDALAYGTSSPLRWFPAAISVSEATDASGFPLPTRYAIASPDSHLLDLAGMLGAFSSIYSLTDQSNAQVGGSQPALAYFDGDPFPVQNQTPEGSPTLHDRALAMMRVLVVNIDRLHVDPATGMFVDDVGLTGGAVTRGTTLSTDVAAYALLGLRTARRGCDSELALYSNTKPDTEGVPSPLDGMPALEGMAFGPRLDQLIGALANVFFDRLTQADGTAFAGWDLVRGAAADDGSSLDAHTAAIRGLLLAYLSTGNTKFRDRAEAVFSRLEGVFYDPSARLYRAVAGDRSLQVTFTPRRFGLLQGALRDTYELLALLPGNAAMAALIEQRVARLNKLVLNGWDDREGDQNVAANWPAECVSVIDGVPRGGLQMAERTLTGEIGSLADTLDAGPGGRVITTDREHDCVPEISAAGLPAALANSITFTLSPWAIQNGVTP
jgi:hypothetical protein